MALNAEEYLSRRRGRYLAQTLEEFERIIEPYLPVEAAGAIQSFKGLTRMRFAALAHDAADLIALGTDGHINGLAQEFKDKLSPVGRP